MLTNQLIHTCTSDEEMVSLGQWRTNYRRATLMKARSVEWPLIGRFVGRFHRNA